MTAVKGSFSDEKLNNIIYGHHAVLSVLKHEPDTIIELWVDGARHDERAKEVVDLARRAGISAKRIKRDLLDEKSNNAKHQGFVALSAQVISLDEKSLESMLANLSEPAFLLILDGIQDPHNLGACLRSADAAGVQGVIIPKDKSCGLTATVRKVASGAVESLPLYQVTNLVRAMDMLKKQGIWLYGTDSKAQTSVFKTDFKGAVAIVMGSEGSGLRRLTREHCDALMSLPMSGSVSSLNISVAAGICMYEAVRQRVS
ncbi:23S rRNA (guanosine(2251)-2'-O)-methyltransferase [hydrothermal vent metagenome]|uniref:23S rRNA (Guanosine(2251)-2'-O)-methyltransferase n=1 Tax=hydrothermal vent metagenome TaxID=652676 RepID=A0A3B1AH14_9ZZZZ